MSGLFCLQPAELLLGPVLYSSIDFAISRYASLDYSLVRTRCARPLQHHMLWLAVSFAADMLFPWGSWKHVIEIQFDYVSWRELIVSSVLVGTYSLHFCATVYRQLMRHVQSPWLVFERSAILLHTLKQP